MSAPTSGAFRAAAQLDAVAVGIEDVDEAHLARQLDDDADPNVFAAQALGLGLHVLDVERGDRRRRRGSRPSAIEIQYLAALEL